MKINLDKTGFFFNFLDSPILLGHNLVANEESVPTQHWWMAVVGIPTPLGPMFSFMQF